MRPGAAGPGVARSLGGSADPTPFMLGRLRFWFTGRASTVCRVNGWMLSRFWSGRNLPEGRPSQFAERVPDMISRGQSPDRCFRSRLT